MSPISTSPPGALPADGSKVVQDLGGFTALNPRDGLFLRAGHLQTMQDYARSLATAAATASGPGVVHGLGVRLAGNGAKLEVSRGLAVTRHGQLLRLDSTLMVPLDAEHLPPLAPANGFWRIELHFAWGLSGSEPVYGSLCNDGCDDGTGSTIAPEQIEGVELRLVPDTLGGLSGAGGDVRRSYLASAYFERERSSGPPWLIPTVEDTPVAPLTTRVWDEPTELPTEAGVPLGVLQDVDGARILDMWTARRLVDGASAHATWRGRLAMRPWSVFLAQLLQFEDQYVLGASPLGPSGADPDKLIIVDADVEEILREPLERFVREMGDTPVARWREFKKLESAAQTARVQRVRVTAAKSLSGLGFVELPPAGYLAVEDEARNDLMDYLRDYVGTGVDLRRVDVRADEVAGAVCDAQHRDRIPLDPRSDDNRPQVDVLVPVQPADKPPLYTSKYGWVAFVRRQHVWDQPEPPPEPDPEPQPDVVTVYVAEFDQVPPKLEKLFEDGDLSTTEEIDKVRYPADGWDYPGSGAATTAVGKLDRRGPLAVVALTGDPDRMPLAALRASLFLASMDSGLRDVPVFAHAPDKAPEAMVVVLRSRP